MFTLATARALLFSNWKLILGAVLIAPAVFMLGQCSGRAIERDAQAVAREKANTAAAQKNSAAIERSGEDAALSAVRNAERQKELYDEVAKIPDTLPDPARITLGCRRLLNAGKSEADLPAVCRSPVGN